MYSGPYLEPQDQVEMISLLLVADKDAVSEFLWIVVLVFLADEVRELELVSLTRIIAWLDNNDLAKARIANALVQPLRQLDSLTHIVEAGRSAFPVVDFQFAHGFQRSTL